MALQAARLAGLRNSLVRKRRPSGAKARTHFQWLNGTTEVVPFPKPARAGVFLQPLERYPDTSRGSFQQTV